MKKKLLLGLLLMFSSLSLNSCGLFDPLPTPTGHEHTFEETWTANELMHYQKASCEHTDLTKNLGEHTFNENGFCTVCNYETRDNFKTFTFNGTNCTCSTLEAYHINDNITLTITPDEDYLLPRSIQVTGLQDFTYDKETGIVTGKIIDDIVITAVTKQTAKIYYLSKLEAVTSTGSTKTRTIEYDTTNNRVKIAEYEDGNVEENTFTITTYNSNHKIIKKEYGSNNKVLNFDEFEYDDNGNLLSECNYAMDLTESILNNKTTYTYDNENRVNEVKKYSYEEGNEKYTRLYTFEYFDGYYIEKRYDVEVEPSELYRMYKRTEVIDIEANTLTTTECEINLDTLEEETSITEVYDLSTNVLISQLFVGFGYTTKFNENNDPTVIELSGYIDPETMVTLPSIVYTYDNEGKLTSYSMNIFSGDTNPQKYLDCTFEYNDLDFISKAYLISYEYTIYGNGYVTFEYEELETGAYFPLELTKAYTIGSYLGLFGLEDTFYTFAIEIR